MKILATLWNTLKKPPVHISLGVIIIVSFFAGIVFAFVGSAPIALSEELWQIVVGRAVTGLGSGSFGVIRRAEILGGGGSSEGSVQVQPARATPRINPCSRIDRATGDFQGGWPVLVTSRS